MTGVQRFWYYVEKDEDPNACWRWAGYTLNRYAAFWADGRRNVLGHRFSYELHHGAVPDGLHVLHHCDNPPCCNPAHLFLGTHTDNMRDREAKGRNPSTLKTHCPRGHPYSADNTYVNRQRKRVCKTCERDRNRRFREENRELHNARVRAYRAAKKAAAQEVERTR